MRKAPHRDAFECSVNDTSRVVFQNCTITTSNNTNCKIYFSKGKTENYVRVEREGRELQQATVGNGGSIFVHGHDMLDISAPPKLDGRTSTKRLNAFDTIRARKRKSDNCNKNKKVFGKIPCETCGTMISNWPAAWKSHAKACESKASSDPAATRKLTKGSKSRMLRTIFLEPTLTHTHAHNYPI